MSLIEKEKREKEGKQKGSPWGRIASIPSVRRDVGLITMGKKS